VRISERADPNDQQLTVESWGPLKRRVDRLPIRTHEVANLNDKRRLI